VTVKDCPKCGLPLIQRDNGEVWCSVYGSHTWIPRPDRSGLVHTILVWQAEQNEARKAGRAA
jgi:uncharacterized Zn finger protein (UPF0148 family)